MHVTLAIAQRGDSTNGDVAGNDREGDVEAAVVEMYVGAADLGVHRLEQCSAGLEIGSGKLPDLERLMRAGHHARGKTRSAARRVRSVAGLGLCPRRSALRAQREETLFGVPNVYRLIQSNSRRTLSI